MTKNLEIYKCNVCGNIIEVLDASVGKLVCCGKEMVLLDAKTKETGLEKHKPLIIKKEGGLEVVVGSVLHPMLENHYIKFIEVRYENKVYIKELTPNTAPKAFFNIKVENINKVKARAYCNLHGLWEN